jgi:hypothetical protein
MDEAYDRRASQTKQARPGAAIPPARNGPGVDRAVRDLGIRNPTERAEASYGELRQRRGPATDQARIDPSGQLRVRTYVRRAYRMDNKEC